KDVTVRNCFFEWLYGHVFHTDDGGEARINVRGCTVRQCANGLNVSAKGSIQEGNTLVETNGIETGGDQTRICNNILKNSTGIAIGGRVNGPATLDCVCVGNVITDCVSGGIVCAGSDRTLVAGNSIDGVATNFHGISVINEPFSNFPSGAVTLANN